MSIVVAEEEEDVAVAVVDAGRSASWVMVQRYERYRGRQNRSSVTDEGIPNGAPLVVETHNERSKGM